MTKSSTSPAPRLVPKRPFPPYAYIPGRRPHPTRDPEGHSYGLLSETPDPPDPAAWRACDDYLYGIDLFNHGFYWEAHEAWEGLWVACGRRGPTAVFLQALINLAAAGFKARWGSSRGVRANAQTALRLFGDFVREAGPDGAQYMGLELVVLVEHAKRLSELRRESSAAEEMAEADAQPLPFDLVLRPQ